MFAIRREDTDLRYLHGWREPPMENKMSVAKVIEITAGSPTSFDDAVEEGIARASKTVSNIQGAWIKEQKVSVEGGKIVEYRVTMKVTFVLSD
jgi:flavin-binding protein dodecin